MWKSLQTTFSFSGAIMQGGSHDHSGSHDEEDDDDVAHCGRGGACRAH